MSKLLIPPQEWLRRHFEFAKLLRKPSIVSHPFAGTNGFDWVIIDTAPDMGFYTQAAITAANYILAPTFPSRAGNAGIEILIKSIQARTALTGADKHAKLVGFVATRYSGSRSTAALQEDFAELQRYIGTLIGKEVVADPKRAPFLPFHIPDTPRVVSATRDLIKATQTGLAFQLFEKEGMGRNDAGAAYQRLVGEVLKRASKD